MVQNRIELVLQMHGIPYYIDHGRIYADNMESNTELFKEVTDVTEYNIKQLREWLGY